MRIDDPVGCIPTHAFAGTWGLISAGLFVKSNPLHKYTTVDGLFKGGGLTLLGIQALAALSIACWSAGITFLLLLAIDKTIGLRMSLDQEIEGADASEHGISVDLSSNDKAYSKRKPSITVNGAHFRNKIEPQPNPEKEDETHTVIQIEVEERRTYSRQ